MPATTKPELTTDKQILYLVQWFAEFSDFQRGDFLADHLLVLFGPFLAEKLLVPVGLNGTEEEGEEQEKVTNGVAAIDLDDPTRPPSIFTCRMKLFTDWFTTWSETDRIEFLLRLRNIDSAFLSEFYRLFLHRNGINDAAELKNRLQAEQEALLDRLDINEKVFESKLPEVLARACPVVSNGGVSSTPDLLTDVVGIKCGEDSAGNSISEEIQEVVMEDAEDEVVVKDIVEESESQKVQVEVDNLIDLGEVNDEAEASAPLEDKDEEEPVQEPSPLVNVTASPPDVVA